MYSRLKGLSLKQRIRLKNKIKQNKHLTKLSSQDIITMIDKYINRKIREGYIDANIYL